MKLLDWAASFGRTPVVPLLGFPGVRLSGASVRECLTSAPAHEKAVRGTWERFSPDAVFTLMDLTVEAEAAGAPVEMPENDTPSVAGHPIKTAVDVDRLKMPDPLQSGRMPVFVETVERLSKTPGMALCTYVIGPFTLAGELAGAEHVASSTILSPDFVDRLLDFCTSVVTAYAAALCKKGASVVAILDPTAVILSPGFFTRFAAPGISAVARAVSQKGAAPVLHVCGDTAHLIPDMAKTGVQALSLDSPVDFSSAIQRVPSDLVLIGNVSPVSVMLEASPETVASESQILLKKMAGKLNFILSSGCDLPRDTPHENIDALIRAVKS